VQEWERVLNELLTVILRLHFSIRLCQSWKRICVDCCRIIIVARISLRDGSGLLSGRRRQRRSGQQRRRLAIAAYGARRRLGCGAPAAALSRGGWLRRGCRCIGLRRHHSRRCCCCDSADISGFRCLGRRLCPRRRCIHVCLLLLFCVRLCRAAASAAARLLLMLAARLRQQPRHTLRRRRLIRCLHAELHERLELTESKRCSGRCAARAELMAVHVQRARLRHRVCAAEPSVAQRGKQAEHMGHNPVVQAVRQEQRQRRGGRAERAELGRRQRGDGRRRCQRASAR
jgi:hypothetical protein